MLVVMVVVEVVVVLWMTDKHKHPHTATKLVTSSIHILHSIHNQTQHEEAIKNVMTNKTFIHKPIRFKLAFTLNLNYLDLLLMHVFYGIFESPTFTCSDVFQI